VVEAVALAAPRVFGLRGVIFGDGPQRDAVRAAIEALGAPAIVEARGFVAAEEVQSASHGHRACCCPRVARATE